VKGCFIIGFLIGKGIIGRKSMEDDGGERLSFGSFGGTDAACRVSFALGSIITLVRMSVGMGLASIIEGTLGCSEDIRVCKSTHMYFLYPFFHTIIP